jgi:hypothetical protein
MMNREMIRLETRKLSSQLLDGLNEEQRARLELLCEEMTESGASQEEIMRAIKHAYEKEIMFAVHIVERQYPTPQLHLG